MLQTRLVFIDTCTFQSRNFQFLQYVLDSVREFCEQGKIRILVTDVLIGEVKEHISLKSEETFRALTKAKKELQLLRNLPDFDVSRIFTDKSTLEDQRQALLNNFDVFLGASSIEHISLNKANIEDVFYRYFNKLPPFSDKKKDEFPDAINISILEQIAKERQMPIYVVSSDNDMVNSCDDINLISLKTVEELLDLIIRTERELAEPISHADLLFKQFEDYISQTVYDDLILSDFEATSIPGGYLNSLEIKSCQILSKNLININRDLTKYNVTFDVEVEAHIFENDYDRSPWDHEEERYVYIFQNEHVVKSNLKVDVSVEIFTVDGLREMADVGEISIPSSIDISNASMRYIDFIEHWLEE